MYTTPQILVYNLKRFLVMQLTKKDFSESDMDLIQECFDEALNDTLFFMLTDHSKPH